MNETRWRRRLAVLLAAAALGACRNDPVSVPPPPPPESNSNIVISERAVVVDSTRWVLISDSTELASGTYRFRILGPGGATRGPTDTTSVVVGDFITGGQAFGFLREVTSVARNNDIITFQTTQAALTDVVLEGGFLHSFPVNEPEGRSQGSLQVRPTVITPLAPGAASSFGANGAISLDGIDFDKVEICGDLPRNGPEVCFEAGFEITKGEIRFVPDVDISGESGGGALTLLGFSNGGTLRLDADLEFSAAVKAGYSLPDGENVVQDPDGDGKKNKKKILDRELFQASTTFSFFIGYLPVFGRILFTVSVEGEAVAGIEATWTSGIHIAQEIRGGLEWNGSRWTDDAPLIPLPTYEEDELVFDGVKGTGEIQVSVVPELNLELYGVVGPFIEIEPYAKVAGEVDVLTGDANAQFLLGTDINLGFKTNDDVKDLTGIGVDYTALGIPLFKERKAIEVFTNNPLDVSVTTAAANGDPASLPARGYSLLLGPAAPDEIDAPWWNIFHLDMGCHTEPGAPGPHRFGNTVCDPEFEFLRPGIGEVATYKGLRTGLEHELVIDKGGARNCAYVGEDLANPFYRIVTDDTMKVSAGLNQRGERVFALDCVAWGQLDVSVSASGAPEDYASGFVFYTGDLTLRTDTTPNVSPGDPFTREYYQEELGDAVMFGGAVTPGVTRSYDAIFSTLAVLEVPTNCTVLSGGGRTLPYFDSLFIASEQVTQVQFDVDCDPLPDVTISTASECNPAGQPCFTDEDGYELSLFRPALPEARGWGDYNSPNRTTPTNFTPGQGVRSPMAGDDRVVFDHMYPHDEYEVTLDEVARSCHVGSGFEGFDGDQNPWVRETRLPTQDSELVIQVVCEGYPPENVEAAAIADTAVKISWNRTDRPEVGGVAGHWVFRDGVRVSPLVPVGTEEFPQTDSFIDYGLQAETTYEYNVVMQASDDRTGATSPPESVTTLSPPDTTPPSAPSNLRPLDVGDVYVELAWSPSVDPESGILEYVVLRDDLEIDRTADTLYRDNGVLATTQYKYEVYAINGDELSGSRSAPLTVTTLDDTTPPSAPSDLRTTSVLPRRVDLAWDVASDLESGIAAYEVERDGSPVGTVTGLAFSDPNVQPDRTYTYEVYAINGSGLRGPGSGPLVVTTPFPTLPAAPSGLSAVPQGSDAAALSWTDNATNESEQVVERSVDGGTTWTVIIRLGPNVTGYLDQPLSGNSVYTYRVQACNVAGCSPYSGPASVKTPDDTPPSAPTGLTAVGEGVGRIELSWQAAVDPESGISNYLIYRDGVMVDSTTSLTFIDRELEPNTSYTYEVSAVNGVGLEGPRSAPATGTTHEGAVTNSVESRASDTAALTMRWAGIVTVGLP